MSFLWSHFSVPLVLKFSPLPPKSCGFLHPLPQAGEGIYYFNRKEKATTLFQLFEQDRKTKFSAHFLSPVYGRETDGNCVQQFSSERESDIYFSPLPPKILRIFSTLSRKWARGFITSTGKKRQPRYFNFSSQIAKLNFLSTFRARSQN